MEKKNESDEKLEELKDWAREYLSEDESLRTKNLKRSEIPFSLKEIEELIEMNKSEFQEARDDLEKLIKKHKMPLYGILAIETDPDKPTVCIFKGANIYAYAGKREEIREELYKRIETYNNEQLSSGSKCRIFTVDFLDNFKFQV